MESTVLGYPRIGPQRELKKATEAYWAGRETAAGLEQTAAGLRRQTWETLRDAGLPDIPSNTFSLYDHVLDTAVMVNAVPERFAALDGPRRLLRDGPRRRRRSRALELTKWFDTNYHYLVPELEQATDLRLVGDKPVRGVPGGAAARHRDPAGAARPGVVPAAVQGRSSRASRPLDLLDPLLVAYEQLLGELHAAGRPVGAAGRAGPGGRPHPARSSTRCAAPTSGSGRSATGRSCWSSTYFGEIGDALPVLADSPVEAIGLDFVAGPGNREALGAIGGIGAEDPGRRRGRRPQRVARGHARGAVAVRVAARPGRRADREHVLLAAARAA